MKAILTIFRKEVASFFNSLVAYMVLTVFLVGVGLFQWIFGENVLISGEAQMDAFFFWAPFFFLFLIPAITMRSFSEEIGNGTIESLLTKPVTDWQILLGKYFAAVFLVFFALLPTLVFYFTLSALGNPPGNIDTGPIVGAYVGLAGLGGIFAAIGIFCSALTDNTVISFILSAFLSFFFYYGFRFLSDLNFFSSINTFVDKLGIAAHYDSISLGVIDTRDLLYFASFIFISLMLTRLVLLYRKG